MNSFLRGTIILICAAFLGECVEFFVNMQLARELKEEGMGIFMSLMPIIFFLMILATLEMPVSISKYIAENKQDTHLSLLRHALRLGVLTTIVLIVLTAVATAFPAAFSRFPDHIQWLLFALIPIAAFSSIARGYFMGIQEMGKIAVSNFLRKTAQLLLLLIVFQLFDYDQETSLLLAIGTMIGSEFIVLLYLFSLFLIHIRGLRTVSLSKLSGTQARQKLLSVSVPTMGLRIFHALTNAVQPFLIQLALIRSGFTEVSATEHFGVLMGVSMSIGFFPAFIAHSLMVTLIPNVSDAHSRMDQPRLHTLLYQSMWLTMLYGAVSVFFMHMFADELTRLFFANSAAPFYLKLLWPYFLFHFFITPLQAFLIGVGLVKDAFFHTIWAHVFAFAGLFVLGSMPSLSMDGVIIGLNFGAVLQALLHYFTVCKRIGARTLFLPRKVEL
ncbi:multidrug transporter MatE [Bacillus sp. FJAT-27225]|uniref:oligosaccharide flippase family protein n=1 Tax=Bacillus sp. FJAT-27225 TaxID=1743144 RepID=UPI00080C27BA|nr:oligosaccharide flippase family protein [Bacillus sp. FJAT-27225]OCA81645.1 multidrug transporter MatE [Bacillus sp. FJAT-27225]